MASKTDRQRILTGGMQLIPPGDKTGEGNSLLLENFRVDQQDELRTRFGTPKSAGPIGSGTFHTFRRSGNSRYAGIGTSFYGYDAAISQTIETGLDGEPLGLAFYRGAGWLMNRSKQRRFIGATSERWGVPAPTTAPVATGGGQVTTLIADFTSGDINVGVDSPPNGADNFSDYAMQSGAPLTNAKVVADFTGDGATVRAKIKEITAVTVYAKVSANLSVDGQTLDTDTIRVQFFASNPVLIESLSVYVRSGTRGDANEGFAEYTFQEPRKWINQSLASWSTLKIQRRLNLDDWSQRIAAAGNTHVPQTISDVEAQFATALQTPTFIYTGSSWPQAGQQAGSAGPSRYPPSPQMLKLNWTAISEIGVTVKISTDLQSGDVVQVGVGKAEVAGTVGENSSGAMQYFVTFENVYGEEGNPSPVSNSVVAGTQTVTVSSIPNSPDANTLRRRIYRIGGGLAQAYLVGYVWGNSGGTFQDTTTNSKAQADNVIMPEDHDLPPPAKGCIGPFFGKILAFNSDAHPARYWWTRAAQPWFFPGALDDFLGNWEDAGGDDDPIVQATDHKQMTLLYKTRSIWRLGGDPDKADAIKTNSNVGLVGPNAVVNGGAVDYFVGWEGVYRFNGDFEEKLSTPIDPIFKGDYVKLTDTDSLPPIAFNSMSKCSIALIGDRLRVSYPEVGQSLPNVVAIYHIPTGRWALERYPNLAAPAFTCMHYEGPGALQMAGATAAGGGGYLYALEQQGFYLDDGHSAKAIWQSRYFDQGLPDNFKIYTDVEVDCQTISGEAPNSPITVYLVIDNGTKINLGSLTSTGVPKPRFTGILRVMSEDGNDVGRKAKNAAIRIEADFSGVIVIYGVFLHWYPEERVARSFDTGPTHLGLPERVKEVDYAEFYLTASGQQLRRVLSSDLPGSLLVHRDDSNLTAPNGRGNVRFRLNTSVDGRNFRLWLGDNPSNSTFQVHQARIRMRPIGEYIDGTIGEFWESPEFSVAPGRVGELKDLLLDYDTTGGAGLLVLYSDLPGNALAAARTITLPAQDRAPRMIPFEIPTLTGASPGSTSLPEGQLFKLRLYPPPGGILRCHGRAVIRARIIGVYFDGTRGEIWETQPLDLLGGMAIFRELSIVSQATGPMTLEMRTELPGHTMRTIASFTVNPTTGRLPFIGRLPGTAKGQLQQFRLVGPYIARVFEAKVLARRTQLNDTPWDWVAIPVEVTPDAWAEVQVPIRNTPEAFEWVDLAVDAIE